MIILIRVKVCGFEVMRKFHPQNLISDPSTSYLEAAVSRLCNKTALDEEGLYYIRVAGLQPNYSVMAFCFG